MPPIMNLYKSIPLFIFLLISALVFGQTTDSFTATGAGTWTCPADVTTATITVYGAGGGGGGCNATADGAGGGGGGGCSQTTMAVVPGNTYNLYVGAGGAGGAGQNDGADGEQSWFIDATTIMANGGSGGLQRTASGGLGGAGAVAGIGTSTFTGGDGRRGRNHNTGRGGAGGGGAGSTANGGGGPTTTYGTAAGAGGATGGGDGGAGGNGANGSDGNTIGGGGSGSGDGTPQTGGDGARGQVDITYTLPAPDNDLCADAITLNCGDVEIAGTTVSTTNVAHGTGCNMSNYGVWYTFVGDGNTNAIFVTPDDAGYDIEVALDSGTCGSLTNINCFDAGFAGEGEGFTVATTLGTTYYVYVASYLTGGTSTDVGSFTISRTCTDNNTCATANTLSCGDNVLGSNYGGSTSPNITGCGLIGLQGSWYTFVGDGQVTTIQAREFTSFDFEMAIMSGSCGSITNIACLDNGISTETYTFTAALGTTYYVYIADWLSTGLTEGAFTISRTCGGSCGNPETNDYCSNPAQLFQGGAGWSSSTTNTYTSDYPANTEAEFCGSIENNSWYEFTAQSTTETFDFVGISGCTDGIQAEVYDVTRDANGCCTNLSSVSNCVSPGNTSDFTLTATGLTVNNTYVMMIDGFAAANCSFSVNNWTATGILPVELIEFKGFKESGNTKLIWTTETEINNDYFLVQKSSNGKDFINIGTVGGNGTTNITQSYSYIDETASTRVNYYRLQQFDYDGQYEYSKVIVVVDPMSSIDYSVYPNPANDNLNIGFSDIDNETYQVKLVNNLGQVVLSEAVINSNGKSQLNQFGNLKSGYYTVLVYSTDGAIVKSNKIIKQ